MARNRRRWRENGYTVRGTFPSDKNIEEQLDRLVEKMGYDPAAERGEEGFLIHNTNPVYETKSMDSGQTIMTMAVGLYLFCWRAILSSIIFSRYQLKRISVYTDSLRPSVPHRNRSVIW